jgi:hypothetical protein
VQSAFVKANAIGSRSGATADWLFFSRTKMQRVEELLALGVEIIKEFILRNRA